MPDELIRAFEGCEAVINCAGPFALTADPVIAAAIDMGVPYFDVIAEPDIAADIFERFGSLAIERGVVVAPALGFYGRLGNLAIGAATTGWDHADHVAMATWLSSWRPTPGTRQTIEVAEERRGGHRLAFVNGKMVLVTGPAPQSTWRFSDPIGSQSVICEFATADAVTTYSHFPIGALEQMMATDALEDLDDPSGPVAVDAWGRSDQQFMIDVTARRDEQQRRIVVTGQDIYAVTAPLVVELASRIVKGPPRSGVLAASVIADPIDVLTALSPEHLEFHDVD